MTYVTMVKPKPAKQACPPERRMIALLYLRLSLFELISGVVVLMHVFLVFRTVKQ